MSLHHSPKIATNGLVGYWDAGNPRSYPGSGNTIYDISGFDQAGTLTNGPTYYNGTLNFNKASSQYIDFGDQDRYSFTNNIFGISFWIKFNNVNANQGILGKDGPNFVAELRMDIITNGVLRIWSRTSNGNTVYITNYNVIANKWYNFVWTADGTNAYLYIDGKFILSVAKTAASIINTTAVLTFGAVGVGHPTNPIYCFDGSMACFSLYNRCLSENEVQQNFNAIKGRFGV